jgi:hypothetical protein
MLKKFLLVLALVAAAASTYAQGAAKDGTLALLYDVEVTDLTYCTLQSQAGGPFGAPIPVATSIKTTGSSTTVVEVTASSNPFTGIVVGDVLVIDTPTATDASAKTIVAVTAKASNASITVDTAINITGNHFGFYHHLCGTTVNDGWVAMGAGALRVGLLVQYDQGDLTALVVRWECKAAGAGSAPVIIYPGESSDCGIGGTLATDRCSFATPGITSRLEVVNAAPTLPFCRVGVAFSGADTSDATTTREKVTIKVTVR